jgi:hypothetical protein
LDSCTAVPVLCCVRERRYLYGHGATQTASAVDSFNQRFGGLAPQV